MNYSYSNRISYDSKPRINSCPAFKNLGLDAETIMNASREELRGYAESLRTLPENVLRDLTKVYGIIRVKKDESEQNYQKLRNAIDEVQNEIDSLRGNNSPDAVKRLNELYDKAANGNKSYYEPDTYVPYYQTVEGIAEDVRSFI